MMTKLFTSWCLLASAVILSAVCVVVVFWCIDSVRNLFAEWIRERE